MANTPTVSLIPEQQKERGFARATSFQKPRAPLGGGTKFGIVLVVLCAGAAAFFFIQSRSLDSHIQSIKSEIQAVRASRDASLESELKDLDRQLVAFESLLASHRDWSSLFGFFEERALQTITFTSLNGDFSLGVLTTKGLAPSYNALAQQIKSFESDERVTRVDVSGIEVTESGLVNFELGIAFKESLITP